MIGSYIVGGPATAFITFRAVTSTATIATSTLTASNEWGYEPPPPPRIERVFGRQTSKPWVASSVAGRLPVVVELRAARVVSSQPSPRATPRRPTWATALRAFHRDPCALSREAR